MIPGLLGLILQFQTLLLTAFAVVRERERGTLEQLVVTPVKPWELMLGKILPFVVVAFANVLLASAIGRFWFGVEFAGNFVLLLALAGLFVLSSLGLGLLISTVSQTQTQAMQMALFIMLPSIILSGFVFPREGHAAPHSRAGPGDPADVLPADPARNHSQRRRRRGAVAAGAGAGRLRRVVFGLSANRFRKTMD